MRTNVHTFFAFALLSLFLSINLALAATQIVGGYEPIKDINDPHIKSIAEFAVSEHNKQKKANLVLVKVISGEKQIVAGTNYKLIIETKVKGGGLLLKDETVVFEDLPGKNPPLMLISFKTQREPQVSQVITGGYTPIPNPNDVKFVAEFAVYEYNAQKGSKLELVKILSASKQIVAGTNYKLLLQTKVKGGGLLVNYEAVVFEGLPTVNPVLKLVSFISA